MRAKFFCLSAFVAACVVPSGCTLFSANDSDIVIVSWNVQNVFDGIDDGTEYDGFRSDDGWDSDDYYRRLRSLAAVLTAIDPIPDVIALEEIENSRVLADLKNDFLVDLSLNYHVATDADGSATQVGVISRFPIASVRSHTIFDDRLDHPVRPVLEVHLESPDGSVVLLVNHWKSRREGAELTEPFRIAAARVVLRRFLSLELEHSGAAVIACGDFNESPLEYDLAEGRYTTAFVPADATEQVPQGVIPVSRDRVGLDDSGDLLFFNPWMTCTECDAPGSYVFDNQWEQLDGFYFTRSLLDGTELDVNRFFVVANERTLNSAGSPRTWYPGSGGVSDHLPVVLILRKVSTLRSTDREQPLILSLPVPSHDWQPVRLGWDGVSEAVRSVSEVPRDRALL